MQPFIKPDVSFPVAQQGIDMSGYETMPSINSPVNRSPKQILRINNSVGGDAPIVHVDNMTPDAIQTVRRSLGAIYPESSETVTRRNKQLPTRSGNTKSFSSVVPPHSSYLSAPTVVHSSLPMSDDEVMAMEQKIRKNASHPFLKKALTCLNCEYFLAYKCGEDGKHRNLCTFRAMSPWNKDFTSLNSTCNNYKEKGTVGKESPAVEQLPKKRRKRRSRAEIEAAKASNVTPSEDGKFSPMGMEQRIIVANENLVGTEERSNEE